MKKLFILLCVGLMSCTFTFENTQAKDLLVLPQSKAIDNKNCQSENLFSIEDIDAILSQNNFTKIKVWGKNDRDLEEIELLAKENLSQYWVEPNTYADDYKNWLDFVFDQNKFAMAPHGSDEGDHKKFAEHLIPLYYGYHALNMNKHLSKDEKEIFLQRLKVRTEKLFRFMKLRHTSIYNLSKCGKNDIWTCNNGAYKLHLVRTLYGATFGNTHYNQGKKIFQIAIDGLAEDGALWREASRGKWSWMYYTHSLNLLLHISEIYYLNGENLYEYQNKHGQNIHDAVNFLIDAMDNNEIMWQYAKKKKGINHYDDWKNYKDLQHLNILRNDGTDGYNAWLYIYASRFPDSHNTNKLLDNITLQDKIKFGESGFDTQCFYPLTTQ